MILINQHKFKARMISLMYINKIIHNTTRSTFMLNMGGHNPTSHQKFFQNPSPSWIFIKIPSRSYQNPSE